MSRLSGSLRALTSSETPRSSSRWEKTIGVDTSKVTYAGTFTNSYAAAADKLEGFTITTKPAGSNG